MIATSSYMTRIIGSGCGGTGADLRTAVAAFNDGRKVWRGEKIWDVSLDWDGRMV
jgi:hypothetical protein